MLKKATGLFVNHRCQNTMNSPSPLTPFSHLTIHDWICQQRPKRTREMNWTGGRLQRHSRNTGNRVINRQKQHFAKVRTQLQNGTAQHTIPFRPSFLQEVDVSLGRKLPPFCDRSSGRVGYSRRLQKSVHYDNKLNSQGGQFDEMSAFPKLTDNSRYEFEGITRRSPAAYRKSYLHLIAFA